MTTSHISDDVLELHALDRLAEAAAVPVEEHLLVCGECRERLAGWDEYVEMRAALRRVESRLNLRLVPYS